MTDTNNHIEVLRRLERALPDVGLNGWHEGVAAVRWAIQSLSAGASGGGDTAEALKWVRRQIEVARAAISSTIDAGRMRDHYAAHEALKQLRAIESALTTPASPATGEGLPKLQRYFPAKPSHPGWEMSPHEDGEWVLWKDVANWWRSGPFTVSKFEGVGHDSHMPISYSVKGGGMSFTCGTYADGEQAAQWLASRLNATPQPDSASEWVMVPRKPTREMLQVASREGGGCTLGHVDGEYYPGFDDPMAKRIWAAMLAAAPQPPSAAVGDDWNAIHSLWRALVDAGGATTVARHGVERGQVEWAHTVVHGMLAIERHFHPERFDDFHPATPRERQV